jgi:hypothetical protein
MGRPRKNFKPYKDLKRKKSGLINFYLDENFYSTYKYEYPSTRKKKINDFLRMAKRRTIEPHTYHYEIIPNIEP